MKFRILDGAAREYREAIRHYTNIRLQLGVRFKDAFNASVDRILAWPLAGALAGRTVRICRLKQFPYGVVYVPRDTEIVVVAVMHLHRRPGYWKRRLKDLGP